MLGCCADAAAGSPQRGTQQSHKRTRHCGLRFMWLWRVSSGVAWAGQYFRKTSHAEAVQRESEALDGPPLEAREVGAADDVSIRGTLLGVALSKRAVRQGF